MRSLVYLFFTLFSINSFSQTKEIKVSKKTISESKGINDIITEIPKDCKIKTYVLSANFKTGYREYTTMGEGIPHEVKEMINKNESGKFFFFIENIKSDCPKSHGQKYKITIE